MLVGATVDIRNRRIVEKNIKYLVANVARSRTYCGRSAKHASDDLQDVRYCTECVIVMLERGLF